MTSFKVYENLRDKNAKKINIQIEKREHTTRKGKIAKVFLCHVV